MVFNQLPKYNEVRSHLLKFTVTFNSPTHMEITIIVDYKVKLPVKQMLAGGLSVNPVLKYCSILCKAFI